MAVNDRFKKVVFYIISQGLAESQEDIATQLGYNPDYLSHIASGIKPVSSKFAEKVCSLSENIRKAYLLHGEGDMLKNTSIKTGDIKNSNVAGGDMNVNADIADMLELQKGYQDLLAKSQESYHQLLAKSQQQTDRLIRVLEGRLKKDE